MPPMDSAHLNAVEAENRSMSEALETAIAWIRHWQDDIAAGLMPTRDSLEQAEIICRKARRKELAQ